MFKERIEKLRRMIDDKGGDAAMIATSKNVFYFTGLMGMWNRPSQTCLLVGRDEKMIVTVEMEEERVKLETGENPITIKKNEVVDDEIISILRDYLHSKVFLFDSLSYKTYEKFRVEFKETRCIESEILQVRSVKSRQELVLMKKSAEITAKSLRKAQDIIRPGMSEHDLSAEIEYYAKKLGAEGRAFPTLITSAERSSLPHGEPSHKKISDDTVVVIDFGVRYRGYCSDYTRFYYIGRPGERYIQMGKAVLEAHGRSSERICAGANGKDAYYEAVKTFKKYGLETHFLHSLGHGVGISVQEFPMLTWKSYKLRRGNVVTVEPGLYVPGFGGVRVEDTVLVKEDGVEPLAELQKEFILP